MYSDEEIREAIREHEERENLYRQETQEGIAIKTRAFKEDLARRALAQMELPDDDACVQAVLVYMEKHQMFS